MDWKNDETLKALIEKGKESGSLTYDELNRALILLYLEGQSYAEIADVLGISETNVATKINRAKQTLRARMNP